MKITINGDAFVVTSSIKLSDIEVLKKTNPEALRLVDEEGNDVFSVDYNAGRPSISQFGITFGGVSRDNAKQLTYTGTIPAGVADAKEFVADIISPVVAYLSELEETIPDDAKSATDTRNKLLASITVA